MTFSWYSGFNHFPWFLHTEKKGRNNIYSLPLLNLLYSNNWQRLTFWYFLRLIFEISLPCWPLHQHAEIKRWVQEQEEAIPEAYTSVHSWEVYVKVLTNTIDNCNSKQWVTIQLGCGPTERTLITQISSKNKYRVYAYFIKFLFNKTIWGLST